MFLVAYVTFAMQGALEFTRGHSEHFHIKHEGREYDIFGHGGMMFWFISSVLFFLVSMTSHDDVTCGCMTSLFQVYVVIVVLPFTPLGDRFQLPLKKSFYAYCSFLAALNATQAVGSGMLYKGIKEGLW